MRKMCKKGYDKSYYISTGSYRTTNVRYHFYRILHEAIMESHAYIWIPSKRYKRKAIINECVYIPLSEIISQFDKPTNVDIWLGNGSMIPFSAIKSIKIY